MAKSDLPAAQKIWDGPHWCELDVTTALRAALKAGRNHGWRLEGFPSQEKRTGYTGLTQFAGRQYIKDPALRPKLVIKVRSRRLDPGPTGTGPVQEVVLRDGAEIGGGPYAGTREASLVKHGDEAPTGLTQQYGEIRLIGPGLLGLVRFAVFRSEGGPVPDGAVIVSARLRLFKSGNYHSGLTAFEVLRDWDEAKASFVNVRAGEKWAAPGCGAPGQDRSDRRSGSCQLSYDKEQWAEMDVTDTLRTWSAGRRANRGWLLRDQSSDTQNFRAYASRRCPDAAKRPTLEIKYQTK